MPLPLPEPTTSMTFLAVVTIAGLIAGILLSMEVGYVVGVRRWSRVAPNARVLSPTMEASIFGLMGLLIAFIFNGASTRFEHRRELIVQESNAIGTAYLRLDLLPPEARAPLREDFRAYVLSRLNVFQHNPDTKERNDALARSSALQEDIWKRAVAAASASGPSTQTLVVSSLNEVIDITNTQNAARATHPPVAVFAMMVITVAGSSALAGYSRAAAGTRDWLFAVAYAVLLGVAVYVILDYEFPRIGLVRIDALDQMLRDALAHMK